MHVLRVEYKQDGKYFYLSFYFYCRSVMDQGSKTNDEHAKEIYST